MEEHLQHHTHVVIFPLMAQGHMNPMIDLARILASHCCRVTMVTTPLNSFRYDSVLEWSRCSSFNMSLVQLPFPCKRVGLPESCENMDAATSSEMVSKFMLGTKILQQPFEDFVMKDPPNCIISDAFLPWTLQAAQKLKIPRYSFNVTSCFGYCVLASITNHKRLSNEEEFIVPGLPHKVKVRKVVLPEGLAQDSQSGMREFIDEVALTQRGSDGAIFNTSFEMEPEYVEQYKQILLGKPVWTIGPLSLCYQKGLNRAEKGGKASSNVDDDQCLKWLDSKEPRSVMYACFGSITSLTEQQLMEIGLGLESSRRPFIWVIRGHLSQSFLHDLRRRVKDKGLVITGWAPQLLILSHNAVGGFMTHCGWNSAMEGISAGLPLITWPMFAEQHFTEKLLVDVLGVAIPVGNDKVMGFTGEAKVDHLVRSVQIEAAVSTVLGDGGREMREKARGLGEAVRKSFEGGSSTLNLNLILQNIGCHV